MRSLVTVQATDNLRCGLSRKIQTYVPNFHHHFGALGSDPDKRR